MNPSTYCELYIFHSLAFSSHRLLAGQGKGGEGDLYIDNYYIRNMCMMERESSSCYTEIEMEIRIEVEIEIEVKMGIGGYAHCSPHYSVHC